MLAFGIAAGGVQAQAEPHAAVGQAFEVAGAVQHGDKAAVRQPEAHLAHAVVVFPPVGGEGLREAVVVQFHHVPFQQVVRRDAAEYLVLERRVDGHGALRDADEPAEAAREDVPFAVQEVGEDGDAVLQFHVGFRLPESFLQHFVLPLRGVEGLGGEQVFQFFFFFFRAVHGAGGRMVYFDYCASLGFRPSLHRKSNEKFR